VGAIPAVFDYADKTYATAGTQRQALVGEDWDAARRTLINAHYTDPSVVAANWSSLTRLGFDGGRVLETGCGSGNFVGYAPTVPGWWGWSETPTTAAIARAFYPDAEIHTGPFERFDPPPALRRGGRQRAFRQYEGHHA
jgi:hypothetical protein